MASDSPESADSDARKRVDEIVERGIQAATRGSLDAALEAFDEAENLARELDAMSA